MIKIDPERDEFYMWIGHCISSWAKVDECLFEICWKALQSPKKQAAIIYFRTPSLDARLTLTDELVKAVLPKPARKNGGHEHADVKKWNKLEASIRSNFKIRRRIAHHPVRTAETTFQFEDDDAFKGEDFRMSWYEIYVSEHENARGKDIIPNSLIGGDLVDHDGEVRQLAAELKSFYDNVLPKHVPKSRAPNSRRRSVLSKGNPAYRRSTKPKPRP